MEIRNHTIIKRSKLKGSFDKNWGKQNEENKWSLWGKLAQETIEAFNPK